VAGPWDRAYGYDMQRYLSLMALWFWVLIGKENSSLITQPQVMSHSADYAYAPCFAVLAAFHRTLVPDDVFDGLTKFSGEHTFTASTYYPPIDNVPRNITSWVSEKLLVCWLEMRRTTSNRPKVSYVRLLMPSSRYLQSSGMLVHYSRFHLPSNGT
jgi:hypothetical protein